MGFEKIYVTKQGLQLEAKARTGKTINILRVEVGDGQLTSDNITEQTSLINKKLNCNINSMQDINGQTIINFILQQSNVEQGFYFREFGVIAKDPDTQQEVLYMYANAGSKAEYMSDKTASNISDKIIDIIVKEDNTDNITISINNTGVYVAREEYQAKIQQLLNLINQKADIPSYQTITLAVENWVLNEETEKYEYTVVDNTITENHSLQCRMAIEEQEKLANAEGDSYNGGFIIRTTELPEADITMDIIIQKIAKKAVTPTTPTEPTTPEGGDSNEDAN